MLESAQVQELIETFQSELIAWGPNLIAAVAILVIGWFVAKLVTALVAKGMNRAGVDVILVRFVRNIAYTGLMALIVIAALGRVGVNTTSFAALIAAAGLAIGLAFPGVALELRGRRIVDHLPALQAWAISSRSAV